jgi:hypothetical protein
VTLARAAVLDVNVEAQLRQFLVGVFIVRLFVLGGAVFGGLQNVVGFRGIVGNHVAVYGRVKGKGRGKSG